eukprot:9442237-Ditylum_brightwellii.AAC.1
MNQGQASRAHGSTRKMFSYTVGFDSIASPWVTYNKYKPYCVQGKGYPTLDLYPRGTCGTFNHHQFKQQILKMNKVKVKRVQAHYSKLH